MGDTMTGAEIAELQRAARSLARFDVMRGSPQTFEGVNGVTIRGWYFTTLNNGPRDLILTEDAKFYRYAHHQAKKGGQRRFLEPAYETTITLEEVPITELGESYEDALNILEGAHAYYNSF